MVTNKLIFFIFNFIFFLSTISHSNPNTDQWIESEKTYKDLINEGFQVKSYSISNIEVGSGVPNKNYDSEEIYELIHITNCFPELRAKGN